MFFPKFSAPGAALVLDLARQLRQFEGLDPVRQRDLQQQQLAALFLHARAYSPYWRQLFKTLLGKGNRPAFDVLEDLPPLTRADLQANFEALRAHNPKWRATDIVTHRTSGSTGQPVAIEKYAPIYRPLYRALSYVYHQWHGRDARKGLGVLKVRIKDRDDLPWDPPHPDLGPVGRCFSRGLINRPVEELYQAVLKFSPAYLMCNPEVVRAFATMVKDGAPRPKGLEQLLTFSSPVRPEDRALASEFLGARIVDGYSSQETGWIAGQCPRHDHYHVVAGSILVEIIDDAGQPCAPGVPGRVLLTSLHSYALPLIRYDVGDLAVWGDPCDCGIRMPVIKSIVGRTRDVIRLSDSSLRYVAFTAKPIQTIAPILEFQIRLYADAVVEMLARAERPLTVGEREALTSHIQKGFGFPATVHIKEMAGPVIEGLWKREEFVKMDHSYCESAAPPQQGDDRKNSLSQPARVSPIRR